MKLSSLSLRFALGSRSLISDSDLAHGSTFAFGSLSPMCFRSSNRSFHLKLDQVIHLDCVLERKLFSDVISEA